jgi:hypothetical protein
MWLEKHLLKNIPKNSPALPKPAGLSHVVFLGIKTSAAFELA